MSWRKLAATAGLALLGLTGALLESSLVHTDDGCVIEVHCTACLLHLRTPGVVTVKVSLQPTLVLIERVALAPVPTLTDATPHGVASRGPPAA